MDAVPGLKLNADDFCGGICGAVMSSERMVVAALVEQRA